LPKRIGSSQCWQQPVFFVTIYVSVLAAASVFCHHLRERIGSSQ